MVIFDQISNNSNVYLILSRFWMATRLIIIFYQLLSQKREYHLKTFDVFRASFPKAFCTNTRVSVADRPALTQNLMATLCSFPPSMMYKENTLQDKL
jgi:hypothetical protein